MKTLASAAAGSLEARARTKSQPASPLSLTRRADLLDLELPEPDLSIYEVDHDE